MKGSCFYVSRQHIHFTSHPRVPFFITACCLCLVMANFSMTKPQWFCFSHSMISVTLLSPCFYFKCLWCNCGTSRSTETYTIIPPNRPNEDLNMYIYMSFLMSHFVHAVGLSAWMWQMYLFAPCFLSPHSHSMTNVKRISSLHESSHSTRTKRVSRMAVIPTVSRLTNTLTVRTVSLLQGASVGHM